ncbi:zinc ribbon domain-containing protein [Stygiolobus caldivivus]|uniref:Zinc ribbon domain-containing protein n=1 Tax=Stygiolobus caldivivus TaxID=2824673 RepID=A0A8D5U5M2_9CREN|nr:zinc ribbon domain-containing protein [Stygiolobus caldivivus]BCU69500.1 zinc ribbon domain-containing protein [Stygiolobus caldivivus]
MSYPPPGYPPYGSGGYPPSGSYPPMGYPSTPGYPYGGSPQNNSMFNMMMCMQPIGLGGKQQMIPIQRPIDLQPVIQQVMMYLMGQGFQVFPMVGQYMAVIQAQHSSFLGAITDSNKAYTIRICEGPNMIMVETGMTNLLKDLIPLAAGAGVATVADTDLHNSLLTLAGGGLSAVDAYNLIKDFMQEDQIMNTIMMAIMTAQSMSSPTPSPSPYPQGATQPSPYPQSSQPYPPSPSPYPSQQPTTPQQPATQPPQSTYSTQPTSVQPSTQTPQVQLQKAMTKCWKCGTQVESSSKFCPNCGASLSPITCPKCGNVNSPGSKYCSKCGAQLQS